MNWFIDPLRGREGGVRRRDSLKEARRLVRLHKNSPGEEVGLRVDVQRRQSLHGLQHIDGIRRPWLKEANVSVNADGGRGAPRSEPAERTPVLARSERT